MAKKILKWPKEARVRPFFNNLRFTPLFIYETFDNILYKVTSVTANAHKKALFKLSQIVLNFVMGKVLKRVFFSINPLNWKHRIHIPLTLVFSLNNFLFLSHRECWFEEDRAQENL